MQNIKAILFDLDGTLSMQLPSGGEIFAEYIRSLGYKISDEDKVRAEHWTHFYFADSLAIRADTQLYQRDDKAFWLNFSKRRLVALGIRAAEALELVPKVSAHMAEIQRPAPFVPEDAFPLLESLKAAGYIMGVASNRDKPYLDKLQEMNLDSYFKFAFAGGEINSFKPNRVFFDHMLGLAGASAAETLYIGDNYFADIVGAQRAGLTPILYDPTGLFSDVDCAVIQSFSELPDLLKLRKASSS